MKKIVSALFMALFCLVSGVMNAQTDKVVRILSIGNSFSEDAVEQHLHDIVVADGKEVIIGNTSLPKHLHGLYLYVTRTSKKLTPKCSRACKVTGWLGRRGWRLFELPDGVEGEVGASFYSLTVCVAGAEPVSAGVPSDQSVSVPEECRDTEDVVGVGHDSLYV